MGSPISIKEIAFIAKINQSNKQKTQKAKIENKTFQKKKFNGFMSDLPNI